VSPPIVYKNIGAGLGLGMRIDRDETATRLLTEISEDPK
jgi:hypothetical protein